MQSEDILEVEICRKCFPNEPEYNEQLSAAHVKGVGGEYLFQLLYNIRCSKCKRSLMQRFKDA